MVLAPSSFAATGRSGRFESASKDQGMYQLTENEAFQAMTLFLEQFYKHAGGDFMTLLVDIGLEADGGTHDPAAWADWMDCVRAVKEETIGRT
jgi:hypothetical protein